MVHSSVPVRIVCVVLPISACSFLTRKPETSKTPLISGRSCTMSVLPLQKISICTV